MRDVDGEVIPETIRYRCINVGSQIYTREYHIVKESNQSLWLAPFDVSTYEQALQYQKEHRRKVLKCVRKYARRPFAHATEHEALQALYHRMRYHIMHSEERLRILKRTFNGLSKRLHITKEPSKYNIARIIDE